MTRQGRNAQPARRLEAAGFSPKNPSLGAVLMNAAEAGRWRLNAVDRPRSWAVLQGGGCDGSLPLGCEFCAGTWRCSQVSPPPSSRGPNTCSAPAHPPPPHSSHNAGCAVAGRTGELGDVLGFRPFRGRPVLQFPHLENGANEECSLGLSHRAHPTRLHRLRLLLKMK